MVARVLRLLANKGDGLSDKWKQTAGKTFDKARLWEHLKTEQDRDMVLWVRRRLLGEQAVDLGREFGYRDGSGITHAVHRIENRAHADKSIRNAMKKYHKISCFKDLYLGNDQ